MTALDGEVVPTLTDSQREWLRVRAYLQDHRHELSAVAAELYPDAVKVAGTPLLSTSGWLPEGSVPLASIVVERQDRLAQPQVSGTESFAEHVRPELADGSRYPSYSAAIAALAAPRVFQNRSTYRLQEGHLAGAQPRLVFGSGTYFDSIDVGEACAHELAAVQLGLMDRTPLRDAVGDPCDPGRRGVNVAVSTLTLRYDPATGQAGFPLHWRDPAKVGHAGGLYQVMPVGVFQASGDEPWHGGNDFSLWRCMLREFAEELLGEPEDHGAGPIDYEAWDFAKRMNEGLGDGRIRASVLGMGVDPLTLATDLLTVVTIDARLYDELFAGLVTVNDEGRLATSSESVPGRWSFNEASVQRLTTVERTQAAGAALLRLAWANRPGVVLPR